ncbi:MAG: sortase [Clostridia bacterium]|nr:sortase [Clostridia bacterium]
MKLCLACFNKCRDESQSCPYCGFGKTANPRIKNALPLGTVLFNRFRLGKVLDFDRTFTTYYALDEHTHRRVKITEYVPETLIRGRSGRELLYKDRFCKEKADEFAADFASNCKKICRANRSGIFDIYFCEEANSTFYYASFFPSGAPLSSLIGNGKILTCAQASQMLAPVAQSLDSLHREGMLHGGINPYNIICKNSKAELIANSMQLSGEISPYEAPELSSPYVNEKCDVYSFAAVYYEAVTGNAPPTAYARSCGASLKIPDSIPKKVAQALTAALDPDPANRFTSAGKFLAATGKSKSKSAPVTKKKTDKTDNNSKNESTGAKEVLRKICFALSCICLVISLGYLLNYYVIEPYMSLKQDDELSDLLVEESDGTDEYWESIKEKYPDITFPMDMNPSFAELYALNPEIAGWVRIPALNINFPVMQAEDNDKYLKTDFYGNKTNYGETFFDYRNNLDILDRNTIIHGHNMRHDDKVFGTLEEYRKIEGFKKAPTIEVFTLNGTYTFKVYAVFVTNTQEKDDNGHVLNYIFTNTGNVSFLNYIEEIDKRKYYTTGVDINENDKILTLSTCCYDFEDARLAVVARLVREGESTAVDTSLAFINEQQKFPQVWYNKKGIPNPYKDDWGEW